jgi:hypothetical protein
MRSSSRIRGGTTRWGRCLYIHIFPDMNAAAEYQPCDKHND